jgi:hypothetical protein
VRDQSTGELLAVISEIDREAVVTPRGDVLGVHWELRKPPQLRLFGLDGTLRWSQPLGDPTFYPPLALEGVILIIDGPLIKAFTYDGTFQWAADAERVEIPSADEKDELQTRKGGSAFDVSPALITWLGGDEVLTAFTGRSPYRVLNVHDLAIRQVPTHFRPTPALAVPFIPGAGIRVVSTTWPKENKVSGRMTEEYLGMRDLEGRCYWERYAGLHPANIVVDAAGTTVFANSVKWDFWQIHESDPSMVDLMLDQCYVRCLDAEGQEVFTWWAESPFGGAMAIGDAGEVLVSARGRLWAFG